MKKFKKVLLRIVLSFFIIIGILWIYLNYDQDQIKVDVSGLNHISSTDIKLQSVVKTKAENKNIIIKDGQFYAPDGRSLFLRGINLGGSTKVPFLQIWVPM
jgi:hypothetical protein